MDQVWKLLAAAAVSIVFGAIWYGFATFTRDDRRGPKGFPLDDFLATAGVDAGWQARDAPRPAASLDEVVANDVVLSLGLSNVAALPLRVLLGGAYIGTLAVTGSLWAPLVVVAVALVLIAVLPSASTGPQAPVARAYAPRRTEEEVVV